MTKYEIDERLNKLEYSIAIITRLFVLTWLLFFMIGVLYLGYILGSLNIVI